MAKRRLSDADRSRRLEAQKEKARKYWENRAQLRVLETDRSTAQTEAEVLRAYKRAEAELVASINAFYKRFASDSGLDEIEARRLLSFDEHRSFSKSLERKRAEIRKLIDADPMNRRLRRYDTEFVNLSKVKRVTREKMILAEIKHAGIRLAASQDKSMERGLVRTYDRSLSGTVKDLEKAGYSRDTMPGSPESVRKAVHEKWLGQDFSSRVWGNNDRLIEELRIILAQAFVSHEGIEDLSRRLSLRMEAKMSDARRLIRTEFNHTANQASLEGYKRDGVKRYRFLAAIDSRTSDVCSSLHGRVFDVKDAAVGVNFPPMHPNCRSTTVAQFDDGDGRYDFSDVELDDEELEGLGISRGEYEEMRAKDKKGVVGSKSLTLTNKEAVEAEAATGSADYKRKVRERIEGEARSIIDAEEGEIKRIEGLDGRLQYEGEWFDIWESIPQTRATLSMQAERLESLQKGVDSSEASVEKLERRIEKIAPTKPVEASGGSVGVGGGVKVKSAVKRKQEAEARGLETGSKPVKLPVRVQGHVDKARKAVFKLRSAVDGARVRLVRLWDRFVAKVREILGDDDDHDGSGGVFGFIRRALGIRSERLVYTDIGGSVMPGVGVSTMAANRNNAGSGNDYQLQKRKKEVTKAIVDANKKHGGEPIRGKKKLDAENRHLLDPDFDASNLAKTTAESIANKLLTYSLSETQEKGKHKAKVIQSAIGITKDNAEELAKHIVFDIEEATKTVCTLYGQKYVQDITLTNKHGENIELFTGWIYNKDGVLRLFTAYIK